MRKHPRLFFFLIWTLCASAGCSRGDAPVPFIEDQAPSADAKGSDAAVPTVVAAAHALAHPEPTTDYVAAQMKGAIMARTRNQAVIHYDGYRSTLTAPTDRVTRITFVLTEAKPTMRQLSEALGAPTAVSKGMLYEYRSAVTGARIEILAEPVSLPGNEDSLVRRVTIQGARIR